MGERFVPYDDRFHESCHKPGSEMRGYSEVVIDRAIANQTGKPDQAGARKRRDRGLQTNRSG
jgi:hypothetical protein